MAGGFESGEKIGIDEFVFEGDEITGFGELAKGIDFIGAALNDACDGRGGRAMRLFREDDGLQTELGRGLAEHFGKLASANDADGRRDGIFGRARGFTFFGWLDLGFCHDAVCTNVRSAGTARVFCGTKHALVIECEWR